jgi:hypothetical protein
MTQQLTQEQANLTRLDELIAAFNAALDVDLDIDAARTAQRAFGERFYAPDYRFTVAPVPPLMPQPIEGGYDEAIGWTDFYAQRFRRRRMTTISATAVDDRLFVELLLEADRRDGTALRAHVASFHTPGATGRSSPNASTRAPRGASPRGASPMPEITANGVR